MYERNSPNGGGDQEMELNTQTKHCSAKLENYVKVNKDPWQWAGCIMVEVCMKLLRGLGV